MRILCLIAVAAGIASGQCYVFSGGGVTFTMNITKVTSSNAMNSPAGVMQTSFQYLATGTLTVGATVYPTESPVGSQVTGGMFFTYVPNVWTEASFSFVGVTPPNGPNWGVDVALYSTSPTYSYLPTSTPAALPPISNWMSPGTPPVLTVNIVDNGGKLISKSNFMPTSLGSCSTGPNGKALGDPSDTPGKCNCGDPIDPGTGNLFEPVADYQTAGPNLLSFWRYYNSMSTSNTHAIVLGANWRSNYDRYLNLTSATAVTAERGDGQQLMFTSTNGAWTTDTDVDFKLTNSGSTWTLTDNHDTVETYTVATGANEGLLQTIRLRNGYTQTLQYNPGNQLIAVTDSYKRQLTFSYSNGLLATGATPDGLILTYGYSGSGASSLLTSVSYSTTPVTGQTYLYENSALPKALTGVIDENGNRYSTWTYDSTGRALTSQHAGGAEMTSVSYNDSDGSRTVTNALGGQTVYKFTVLQGVPKVTEVDRAASAGVAAATRKFTYDGNGYTASQTDWNGNVTSYVNDAHGQPTTINEAVGTPQARSTTITYHPTFHLPVKVVTPGLTTNFTYDATGEMLTQTLTDTTTTAAPYSTAGQTRTWTFTWSNFRLASMKTPRTDVNGLTSFTYDASGAVTAITNALGQTTQVTQHSPSGYPETIVDANGVTTSVTYDPRMRLLSGTVTTAAGPLTTSNTYDAAGDLINVTQPDGSALTFTFDAAHRLTGKSDLFNQASSYTLDAQGNRTGTSVADASANVQYTHSAGFDSLGRLAQDIGGAGQTTSYAYDSNGNTLAITDPLNHATHRAFDALNRLVSATNAAGGVASTTYDAHDRPLSVTDPNGGVTAYVYDGFGDLIQFVNPDSGTTVYRYDSAGNLAQTVNGAGAIANYTYDALDRISTVSYPGDAAENVAYTYDQGGFGIGRITGISDAAGTLARSYDERGDVLTETLVNGTTTLATTYTWDAAGRVASITYPSGWTAAYTRDTMGRVTAVTAQAQDGNAPVPVLTAAAYQPFGPINGWAFGNGVAEARSFDPDYRLTALADAGAVPVQGLTYSYDAADRVLSIADAVTAGNSQTFGYDTLNPLTSAAGSYGSIGYSYDSANNRLTTTEGGTVTAYAYKTHSNQLSAVTASGSTQGIAYDKAGNVNSFNPAAGGITSAVYNQAGRLAAVMAGSSAAAQYTYDALGRRVVRVGAVTGTTLYQYGVRDQLLEESDAQGNPLADYIYLDSTPVATISPAAGQVYYLHNDRLGTPQAATDSNQNVVWSASYTPFGELNSIPNLIVQDLRLPGQEFDAETGLYHNGFRDYAPGWGRYLQSDPIGLSGSVNAYAYANGDPVDAVDTNGLAIFYANHHVEGDYWHSFIVIVPDDQAAYANDPRFQTNSQGLRYLTIGAGPVGAFGSVIDSYVVDFNLAGPLISGINQDADQAMMNRQDLAIPSNYTCENAAINGLLYLNTTFNDNSGVYNYTLRPQASFEYNSNSYAAGLLLAAGFTLPTNTGANTIGFNYPVPASAFSSGQVFTVKQP